MAGDRASMLSKKRALEQEEYEEAKKKMKEDRLRGSKRIDDKFSGSSLASIAETSFREKTVGLVSAEDFARLKEESDVIASGGGMVSGGDLEGDILEEKRRVEERALKRAKKDKKKKQKKMLSMLSFGNDSEVDEFVEEKVLNDVVVTKKNPDVDTDFLPDKQREEKRKEIEEKLKADWLEKQASIKEEQLEIVYSYWDGSGNRREIVVKKGNTIGEFLEMARRKLAKEFREVANVGADALLYIKEDLIIPQDVTFHDLILMKARGKSGPLFNFDVHDDVRVGVVDVRVEKDESHPGKVVERRWYERNKHVFPASRWETWDPDKDYGSYTIHGGEVNNNK